MATGCSKANLCTYDLLSEILTLDESRTVTSKIFEGAAVLMP
ncbi:hypothetical protein BHE75_03801 [Sphingomonas haloaromaticamans]|uniref:Uncharacterized protein n=1 Tax=Edaphosphingomonas haloaromaticamans TaxID=653954 RepID=A0A1S1HMV1_9SPHN|nr:hypothetical protein BHE75_03801 [Sphingomonas haloaromaticamans]